MLTFLGTSSAIPQVTRNQQSLVLRLAGESWMFDCGEGTQRQILRSGIGFKKLNHIMLTHGHLDHILGLGGLVSTFTRWETIDDFTIWGGKTTLQRVESLLYGVVFPNQQTPVPVHLKPVEPGIFYRGKKFTVTAFPVVHRGPDCYGYIFKEDDHRPFLAEKADALGVPFGPERGRLVQGQAVTLADGSVIQPEEVLGETIPGVKVVFTGDVGRIEPLLPHVQDADALVIEGTFLHEEADMARRFGHLTIRQGAEIARNANVRNLLVTHVSRRYRERDMLNEARAIFPEVHLVRDFDQFTIRRDKPMVKSRASYRNTPENDA